jgi:hypothetical protein
MKVGNVLANEIISGDNLATGYGYGAELALFTGNRFEFVPKIGYLLWHVRLETNGSVSLAQASIMAVYENKGRYALLNVMQSRHAGPGVINVENTYLAGLTPLHDDMGGLGLERGDEPDLICPYYFFCFSILDVKTGGHRLATGACQMTDDFKLFQVRKCDTKVYFTLNWREVEDMARAAVVLTTGRA